MGISFIAPVGFPPSLPGLLVKNSIRDFPRARRPSDGTKTRAAESD